MRSAIHLVLGALIAATALFPLSAQARPAQITVHDPFTEGGRFTLKSLRLQGEGNFLSLGEGGRIRASIDLRHHCPSCGGSINQIIVGIAGEPRAQACIYTGAGRSGGWRSTTFDLDIPNRPGTYEIRARYAQAGNCQSALGWWRVNRPRGPSMESTIGVVEVQRPAPVALPTRGIRDIQRDIDEEMAELSRGLTKVQHTLNRKPSPHQRGKALNLSKVLERHMAHLQQLQAELNRTIHGLVAAPNPGHHGPRPQPTPRPRPVIVIHADPPPPPPIIEAPQPPQPMARSQFEDMKRALKAESFESSQLDYLGDVLRTNPWFTAGQAVEIMELFSFSSGKVEAGSRVCRYIVEEGAFLKMVQALTFSKDKKELRKRTGGACGGWE